MDGVGGDGQTYFLSSNVLSAKFLNTKRQTEHGISPYEIHKRP
jgi:hypothetical protein